MEKVLKPKIGHEWMAIKKDYKMVEFIGNGA